MAKNSEIRVTSGKFRGRILRSPESELTHPMGAREKLALFNMVNVENATILDAYAGSGALGIEALSRGAKEVIFVEKQPKIARIIWENLALIGLEMPILVEKMGDFAEQNAFRGHFEAILADPPYNLINTAELNKLPVLLKSEGILALSSPANQPEIELERMRISSSHTYAGARLTIYRRAVQG